MLAFLKLLMQLVTQVSTMKRLNDAPQHLTLSSPRNRNSPARHLVERGVLLFS